MKNSCEDLKLLNAALADESWESFQTGLRNQTAAALRSSKRRRALFVSSTQLAALLAVVAMAWFNLSPRSRFASRPQTQAVLPSHLQASIPPSSPNASYITQEEMLAMFPKESCVLAEIDGHTELVFFDAAKARDGFDSSSASN